MEFKYCNSQIRRTPLPLDPLSAVPYVSRYPLRDNARFYSRSFQGREFVPSVFPGNVEEAFQRELEKEEIRREIFASEMELARRRELEEEVRREIASERVVGIPMRRLEGTELNNMFDGSLFHVDKQHASTQNINDKKVIILPRPNVDHCGGKRKTVTPTIDNKESSHKKVKKEWSCKLCQITTTSEKDLNVHIQGKKHKAKASIRIRKIGMDSRSEVQTLDPRLTLADIGKLESKEDDQDVHRRSKGLPGMDNQNETNALTKRRKFQFWCEFCQIGTRAESVMQSHKNGKKHLLNIKKISQNNGDIANLG